MSRGTTGSGLTLLAAVVPALDPHTAAQVADNEPPSLLPHAVALLLRAHRTLVRAASWSGMTLKFSSRKSSCEASSESNHSFGTRGSSRAGTLWRTNVLALFGLRWHQCHARKPCHRFKPQPQTESRGLRTSRDKRPKAVLTPRRKYWNECILTQCDVSRAVPSERQKCGRSDVSVRPPEAAQVRCFPRQQSAPRRRP